MTTSGWLWRVPVLPDLFGRWIERPHAVDPDEQWAEDFVGWVRQMRSMEGTRCLRRPLPYPVTQDYPVTRDYPVTTQDYPVTQPEAQHPRSA